MIEEKKENNQKIENQKTKKCYCNSKTKKIIAIIFAIIIIGFFIWVLTLEGPKSSQEEWLSQFSEEDLKKLDAQYNKANIPTRTTPEQTYAALKEALKNEDVNAAAECFAETVRKEYKDILLSAEKDKKLKKLGEALPVKITEVYTYEAISQYEAPQIVDGQNTSHTFEFTKDNNGDWKIESL